MREENMMPEDFPADDITADYDLLAAVYDLFQEDYQPEVWADYLVGLDREFSRRDKQGDGHSGRALMLDLGCGTGRFCIEMTARGYETIGLDKSAAMLDQAMSNWQKAAQEPRFKHQPAPLFICQDITRYDLFGTVDLIVSLLDTINHITETADLARFFRLCANYLNPGGLLIFDAVSAYHLQEVLGDQVFYQDLPEHTLLWQNHYDKQTQTSLSDIVLFAAETGTVLDDQHRNNYAEKADIKPQTGEQHQADDQHQTDNQHQTDTLRLADDQLQIDEQQEVVYRRYDLQIRERYYSQQDIQGLIQDLPLELVSCYHPFTRHAPEEKAQRVFYIIRRCR